MVLKPTIGFMTQVWHQYPDISLYLQIYQKFKFEVCFILGTLVLPEPISHGPKTHNIGFSTQVWHQYPDISLYFNILYFSLFALRTQVWHQYPDISLYLKLYREFKFEVRFIIGPLDKT